MLKNHFTGSAIMPSIVHFKSTINGRAFFAQQIPYRHIAIDISRNDHGIICIQTNASATQKWFFVNPVELFAHHVDHDLERRVARGISAVKSVTGLDVSGPIRRMAAGGRPAPSEGWAPPSEEDAAEDVEDEEEE